MQSDAESVNNGCVSGHSFTLTNQYVRQKVRVKVSTEAAPVCYVFSIRIKKGIGSGCHVRIHNDAEEYDAIPGDSEELDFTEFVIDGLYPRQEWYEVEIYANAQGATFTDVMLTEGEHKVQWARAADEVMNAQLSVDGDGVIVRSSKYQGDYTAITPIEFAGYSNAGLSAGASPAKVFYLNRDVTNVKKLKSTDEVGMVPIKVVPVTEGDLQGWAFVPST